MKSDNNEIKIYFEKGNNFLNNSEPDKALECFIKILEVEPDNLDAIYGKGISLLYLGKYDKAGKLIDKFLEKEPNNVDALNDKGLTLLESENYSKSINYFEDALKIDPNYFYALYNKGRALYGLNKFKEAFKLFESALKIDKSNTWVLISIGNVLWDMNKLDDSIKSYDKVIELDSQNIEALAYKGGVLLNQKKPKEALKWLNKSLKIESNYIYALLTKGKAYKDLNDYKQALNCFDKVLKIDPKFGEAWYQKGNVLRKLKKDNKALEAYKKFVENAPPHLKVIARRVNVFITNFGKKEVTLSPPDEPKYWQWVTRSKYFLEEDGSEREALEPLEDLDVGGWWTCHKDTRIGDLILLYRAGKKAGTIYQDIKYLIQATSDAYSIVEDEYAFENGWQYGCDYKPIYKFKNSLKLDEMHEDPYLDEWNALNGNFQRQVYKTEKRHWDRLIELLVQKNSDFKEFIKTFEPEKGPIDEWNEKKIEKALINKISILNKYNYDLEFIQNQVVCKGNGGRMDILCKNKKNNGFIVIELKIVRATQNTFAQISNYMGWVIENCANGNPVNGIVISKGYDNKFLSTLKITDKVEHIELSEILGHLGVKLT